MLFKVFCHSYNSMQTHTGKSSVFLFKCHLVHTMSSVSLKAMNAEQVDTNIFFSLLSPMALGIHVFSVKTADTNSNSHMKKSEPSTLAQACR